MELVSRLSEEDLQLRNKIKEDLLDVANKEESVGNKNLDCIGLNMGNTSFFHKVANIRRTRTFISS